MLDAMKLPPAIVAGLNPNRNLKSVNKIEFRRDNLNLIRFNLKALEKGS